MEYARITWKTLNGKLPPLADGKLLKVTSARVMSAVAKLTTARVDLLLLDGLVMEPDPADDDTAQKVPQ